MQKFLRTLTLMALMLVPWVTQAQQTLPYSYGFEDNDLTTDGWLLLNATSSSTGINSSAAQNGSYGFQFIYSESNDATLISPVLTGTTNGVTVSFSYKESSDSYGDEQFYVGYTTDETVTSPSDFTYGSIITASLSWQQYENTFPAGTKRIAIKYVYNDALYLFLDDFTFEAPSSCVKPSAINITGATTSSISISWIPAGSETSWNVYLDGVQVNTTPVATTSYTFTGLTENNDYTLGVTAICGSSESAPKTTTMHLGYCVPAPTSVDGSGISNVTFGSSLIVNDNLSMTSSPYYYDHSSQIGDVFPGGTVNMSINYVTDYSYYTWVWVDWNNDFTFSESEKVYAATSSISSGILNLSFDVPSNTPLGDYRMRIMGKDGTTNNPCYTGSYAYLVDYTLRVSTPPSCMPVTALTGTPSGTTVTLTWTDENNTGATYIVKEGENVLSSNATSPYVINGVTLGDHTYSVLVDCGSSTANPVSTNVHVGYCVPSPSNVDGTGITSVSFGGMTNTTHLGSTAGYADYSSMAGSVPAGTTASVDIVYGHQYTYGTIIWVDWNNDMAFSGNEVVFAGQSPGGSASTNYFTATFDIPATQALGNYRMRILGADSYFDNYTGSLSAAANANPCATGYSWGVAEDYTLTVTPAPTCYKPTTFTYDNVTTNGATLTWTRDTRNADGETYSILDENDQVVTGAANISGTSFQLTGLTDNTEYTFKVRTNCADPSENVDDLTVTFTTLANCQAPVLAANGITNITAHTADVAWTGFASNNSYVVSYRTPEYLDGLSEEFAASSAPTGWTRYSGLLNDVLAGTATLSSVTSYWNFGTSNGVFNSHARLNIYGTSYKHWLVTPEIAVPNNASLNFDLALTAYSGTVASPATNGTDDKFVVLVSTDNMSTWSILRQWDNAGSSYVYNNITCSATGENVNIDLSAYAGQNVKVAFYGESTVSNADNNLHIDNVAIGTVIPATAWQTVPANTTSTTLTGLADETPYEVKVTGICAGNVESEESAVQTFTTLPSCMAITGLTVSDVTTNSVMLTWTDNANTGATYTIYNVTDNNSIVASGVNATTYTVTGLTENTAYTFGVLPICQEGETTPVTVSTRTACAAKSLPLTWTFEADELMTTSNSVATPALPWCSYRYVTPSATSGTTYPYSYSSSTYAHNSTRSLYFYGTTSATYPLQMAWIMPEVDVNSFPMNGNRVTFYARSSSASNDKVVHVGTMTDPTDWSTYTEVGTVTVTGTTHTLYKRSLSAATATDAYVVLMVERGSGSLYIDDVTLEELPACVEITNLAVADATDNTLTLTWTDADNEDVTYTIYNMDDNSAVATGVNTTTYTVTGLTANTPYFFGVQANCLTGDASMSTVNARTACPAITPLPYAEDFSEYTGFASTSYPYYGPSVMPHCWLYYSNGTNTALTNSTSSYYGGVGVATGTSYGSMVANDKYLYMPIQLTGANVTNSTYINYGTQRGSVKIAAMPLFDLPLNNIQVSFNYKMSSTYSATGAAAVLELGYITNDDFTTFEPMQSWNAVTTTQSVQLNLNELAASAPANARLAFKFSGTHNGTGTSSYATVHCGIDNISVEEIPTVLGVTASNVTANSVDLNWDVFRTCAGVSYTVTYGSESTQVSTTNTTISGLTPNTEYTFEVSSSCAAPGEPTVSVTVTTLQIPATMPYATGFETTDDNAMWTILNGTNGWYFGTAANNDGAQGLYISNDNGTNNAYTNNVATWSYAYRLINIAEAGWYNFSFDWKANGESTWDYLRAWLAPTNMDITANANPSHSTASTSGYNTTTPEGWIDLNPAGGKLNLSTAYQSLEKVLQVETAGQYYLVLAWANDGSGGNQPPAAVDNVKVTRNAFEPTDLTATNITSTGATLTWTRDTRNAGNETYTIMNGTETVATGIDANNYNVTLTPNTDYTFSVYATNSLDNSDAENVSIRVNEYPTEAGKMVNLTYSYDFTTTGETPNVDFYYGMGTNRTATAAQSLTAATADGAVFTNTTSLNWSVDGPVTVVFLNHNATALNFSDVAVTYLCPAVITDRDAVVETINTGSFTWTTPENHEYNYGPVHGTTLNEQVAALVGTYNDTVLNAGLCDSVYNHLNLTIYPTYEVTLTDEFCEGITYTVGTGDEAHNYTASIQEDVHLTAIGGADSLVHVNLQMNAAPVALINNNVSNTINGYCEGFDLTLNASAVEGASVVNGAIFEWEDATTAATRVVNPLSTTNNVYTLNATDPVTGCVSLQPATLTVTTTPVPVLTVTADRNAICLGQNSAVLSVTDANNIEGVTFRWYNANTNPATVAGTGATLTVNPTETTVYYVVAEGNCNVQSDNITINVNALPVVEATAAPTVICQNGTITLTATNVDGYNYSWNTNATTATATVAAATTGNFTVTVTDQNGCVNEFTTNNVTVNPVYELNDAQSVCYIQNPYTWKAGAQTAMSITADGNYDYTFQTVNGCDSLVHLTFAFEQMSINNTYREVCQNTDVTWGPTTYTSVQESATYTYELGVGDIDPDNNILECPAQYNLILTVNPVKATSFEQVACDTYTWNLNGETYTADATPSVTLATTKGCDSTVTMNLTVNYQNTGTDVQVACDSYEWPLNHNIYTESNNTAQYTLIGANAAGCDSVVTLNLTVNYKKDSTVFYRECDHTTFVWTEGNGQTYNLNVAAEDNITWNLTAADPTVTTVDGCDSILHLSLVMNYVSDTLNWVNIEECDSWYVDTVACDGSIGRKYIDESGDYLLRTRNAATGRDRISRVHLTINRSEHQTVVESQCVPWIWNADANISHEITSDTILSQELETTSGCQLIKVLRFTAKYPSDNTTLVTRCQNQSWTDGNSVVYDMTNYELGENAPVQWNMTTNEVGCDSIDYVVFTVNPVYNVNGTLTYCEGEFTNGALTYTNPNNATETIELTIPAGGLNEQVYNNTVVANWTTAAGCDCIVTIAYTVNPSVTEDVTVQNCYTYTWNGREYNTLGLTEDTFETVSALTGCDSTAILHLTLTDTVIGTVIIEACGEYTYNNVTYRESKTFVEESGVANSGCDSVTHFVYHLTPRVMKDVYVVANAPYTWDNGETYTAAVDGIYYDATEPGGCDSILVLHLTMEQPIVICEGELPYTTTFGITLTDDTDNYTETVNGVLYDIDYTVNHNTVKTVTVDNACNSYNWHGQTYTVSGTYTFDTANVNGCDSTVTLALTVNVSTDSVLTYEVCDTYTWSGITFTKSADTTLVGLTNFAGCDSTATLHLTINVNPGVEETVAICNSYVWNNQTLTVTGDYNQSFNDANGCTADSVLHLTINTPTDNNLVIIDTAASTYYNGTYYADINEANGGLPYTFDVLYEGANVNGCDSTDHVTLYVTRGVVTDENFNICGNFTWTRNNHTYVWIDAAERQANGNALYKDITDATAPVYIHTGENPIAVVADAMGVPTQTYVLWLNMIEANYFDYDLGDIMLSDQTSITVNPGDSLDAQTIDLSTYIAAKENATLNVTLHHTSTYYCENVVTYTANLIYNFVTDDPVTVCDVTSWTDPVDGVHTVTIGAANDIDYITTDNWHHHVVVNVTARTISTPQVATACDTYTWTAGDGQTYTISGNYPWNDDVNCTTETLQLTINTNAGSTETATECDTYTWNAPDGQNYTYTEGGVKTVQFTDANGCEGTATLNLTINTNAGTTETETACDSYTWQYMAAPLTESDVYTVNYTDANGCEGVHTLNLTINAHQDAEFSDAACVTYTWADNNDAVYTTSGDYTRPIMDANNCSATETLHLTINQPESEDVEFWFGEGSYRYTGIFTTATSHMYTPGDYTGISETVTGVTANGCDSIYNITLHVGNNYSHTEAVRSCNTYTWDRNDVTYVRLTDEQRAANPTALYFDQTNNELVYYNPVVVEPRVNDYADEYMLDLTLDAITERDTVIYFPVSLGVLNYAGQTYDYTMTNDEGRVFVDTTYEYEIHLGAVQACDSIINLTVHVLNNYILDETVDVCYTETSYTWQGQTLTLDANPDATNTYYMYDLNTNDNTVHYITLIQHPIQYTTERRTECDSYIWNGRTFTESTSGATLTLTDQFGCDSTVTLVLYINHNTSTVLGSENAPIVTCDSYTWTLGDNTELPDKIEESGVYTWDYTTAEGCESHDTLYLTVNASTHTVDEITACDTYTWDAPDNNSYDMTADAEMLVNYNNEYGCASTATLNLTINHSSSSSINKAECDTYTWTEGNNQTYTESGVYTYVTTNAANCDSTVTLTLTIDHSNGTTTATACDSYTWTEGNNLTYTKSGTYEYTSDVANSCGSLTQTLVLTIHKNAGHSDTVAICNSNLPAGGYEWHGNYYNVSTVDYVNYFDTNNCPSVDTLNLVIGNVRTYGREYVENCGPFTWELTGETFTESTEASTIMAGANAVGCDSVLYLYLTVKHAPVVELGETVICESALPYIWEGEEYTESGDYNKSFALDNGCDSVINMTLTVSSVKDTNLTDQICLGNGYTANDFNIAAADIATAGEYTFTRTLTSSLNCDSVVTLTLTVGDILTNTVEATACDSYAWNAGDGQTYNFTESGTYNSGSYANAMGCTTVDELTLTINQNSSTGYTETVCDVYMWNGTQYTESGDYTYGYTDNNNCESVDTLHLTVNNSVVNNIPVTACDSYTWENGDGQTYTVSGVYTYSYTTTAGCNGTDYLVLTINTNSNAEYNETVCDTYTWHNTEYTESGDYEYDYEAANGCPSTDVLHLTVNESTTSEETAENCSFYNWHGETYTTTGDYSYVTTNDAGCQHIATLHLTINNPVVVTIDTTVCGYLTWNGISYNESDVITHSFTAANGCDSTEIINLTVNNIAQSVVSEEACDSYTWDVNGNTYDHSGNYVAVLAEAAANGCDSMITLVLTVNHSSNSSETATACDSYTWNGQTYTTSGVQTYEYNSVEGCPSVDTLYLTINNSAATNENIAICNSYTWNGVTYTNSGVYTNTYQTVNGCDSTVTLTLTINPAITNNITESVCGSYTWDNTTYTTSGIYTNTYTAVSGCDSIVNLYLTILAPISITNSVTACDSYTWNNTNYTTSGNYTHTYTAANGCDSVVTLALTINASASTTLTATACDSYVWNGATYTASGSYVQNGLTVNGCDSTVTLNLTINPIVTNTISESVCGSYTWNGTNYTTSGIYTHTYTAVTGCDSIVNLMLTITPPVTVTNHVTACDSYTWNGQTYTTSGNYSTTYTGANGCDSIVTLNLTINNSTSTTVNETACGGYIWNGQTYTTSGVYLYNYTGVNGCDSTVTLNLTIAQSVATSEAVSACESYIWNGTTYTTSGNYTHTYTAVNGCDSVVTLQLTVNMPTTGVDNQTACDSYTWINGQTYTASTNTPVFTITNVAGCDSVVTLNLTLGYTAYAIDEQEACDSYIWIDNQNYTESVDDATYTLHTAEGCDSIVTLHLTINYSVEVYDTIDVLQSQLPYTYNGVDITAAGNYEFNGTTVNGCDSTIYLRVNVTGDMPTAVDVVNILNDVNIYPNPTHGRVTVTADNVVKIEVLDIVGRLVATFDNTNTFDISNLNEGAYTLRITLPEGVTVRKVVRK